jgi:uncharacterized protein with gpF-like domain
LVRARGKGREQIYRLEVKPLAQLHRDWFEKFARLHDASLHALKEQVESQLEGGTRETTTWPTRGAQVLEARRPGP